MFNLSSETIIWLVVLTILSMVLGYEIGSDLARH